MLTVRAAQIAVLEEVARQRFSAQLADTMAQHFPQHVAALGASAFEAVIEGAAEQAARFGLREPAQISDYVCIVLCCGERFYEWPEFAWARALLASTADTRAKLVLDRVLANLDVLAARTGTGA
jgi:hypothetical protein